MIYCRARGNSTRGAQTTSICGINTGYEVVDQSMTSADAANVTMLRKILGDDDLETGAEAAGSGDGSTLEEDVSTTPNAEKWGTRNLQEQRETPESTMSSPVQRAATSAVSSSSLSIAYTAKFATALSQLVLLLRLCVASLGSPWSLSGMDK
jgi:hypothetical protein